MNVLNDDYHQCAPRLFPHSRTRSGEGRTVVINAIFANRTTLCPPVGEHFATSLARDHKTLDAQVEAAYRLALARRPTDDEKAQLVTYAKQFGMANTARVILNLNEFLFVD